MTIKFLKQWRCPKISTENRVIIQAHLDGGAKIARIKVAPDKNAVLIGTAVPTPDNLECTVFYFDTPAKAVKFAAALKTIRRPVRLLKTDLDADWAERVKERDNQTCVMCGVQGAKGGDSLTAHHWLKTKARSGMARWARPCGVTVHYAEHIHTLHENPCWVDLNAVYYYILGAEGNNAIEQTIALSKVAATEDRVRKLWFERIGCKK